MGNSYEKLFKEEKNEEKKTRKYMKIFNNKNLGWLKEQMSTKKCTLIKTHFQMQVPQEWMNRGVGEFP